MYTVEVYPPYVCSCWCIDEWLNPITSKNRTKIEEAIDKARKTPDKVRFTTDIDHSLSEITKILKIFNPDIEMPELIQDKDVHLKVEKKTISEIVQELGLTMGKNT
jgi:F0F1-type ATP synthase delta subunit